MKYLKNADAVMNTYTDIENIKTGDEDHYDL